MCVLDPAMVLRTKWEDGCALYRCVGSVSGWRTCAKWECRIARLGTSLTPMWHLPNMESVPQGSCQIWQLAMSIILVVDVLLYTLIEPLPHRCLDAHCVVGDAVRI